MHPTTLQSGGDGALGEASGPVGRASGLTKLPAGHWRDPRLISHIRQRGTLTKAL